MKELMKKFKDVEINPQSSLGSNLICHIKDLIREYMKIIYKKDLQGKDLHIYEKELIDYLVTPILPFIGYEVSFDQISSLLLGDIQWIIFYHSKKNEKQEILLPFHLKFKSLSFDYIKEVFDAFVEIRKRLSEILEFYKFKKEEILKMINDTELVLQLNKEKFIEKMTK